jgi:hypothetical protein
MNSSFIRNLAFEDSFGTQSVSEEDKSPTPRSEWKTLGVGEGIHNAIIESAGNEHWRRKKPRAR